MIFTLLNTEAYSHVGIGLASLARWIHWLTSTVTPLPQGWRKEGFQ